MKWFSRKNEVTHKSQEKPSGPTIFELIKTQIESAPDKPLDYNDFPKIHEGSSGISFAPGVMDAILSKPDGKGKDWKKVKDTIQKINRNKIKNWQVVEEHVREISPGAHVDNVLRTLPPNEVTPIVKRLFWEVAKSSHNYEAVKWGIAIGGLFLKEEEVEDLLVFARHGEFTVYTSHILLVESERKPCYKKYLISLLPLNKQWAVIHLIDYIVSDRELIANHENQEKVLLYGMENNDGIPMEVAFTIAKNIDILYFLDQAAHNARIFSAVVELFESLLTEPEPLGGICDLDNGKELFSKYLTLIEEHRPDIEILGALRTLRFFLDDIELDWDSREQLLATVKQTYDDKLSSEVVHAGLKNDKNRWQALQIIKEEKLVHLLPEVARIFVEKHDIASIDVLGQIGATSHLELMLSTIPNLVDTTERKQRPFSKVNVHGPDHIKNMEYSLIVKYIGRLGTQEAISQIKMAASDYDPSVRSAAMGAIADLPAETIDDELRDLVRERLTDSPQYVIESAKNAAKKIGLSI